VRQLPLGLLGEALRLRRLVRVLEFELAELGDHLEKIDSEANLGLAAAVVARGTEQAPLEPQMQLDPT
jgi:hypothetical protein